MGKRAKDKSRSTPSTAVRKRHPSRTSPFKVESAKPPPRQRKTAQATPRAVVVPSLEDPLDEVLHFRNEHGKVRKHMTVDAWIAHKVYKGARSGVLQARSKAGTEYKLRVELGVARTPSDPFRVAGVTQS